MQSQRNSSSLQQAVCGFPITLIPRIRSKTAESDLHGRYKHKKLFDRAANRQTTLCIGVYVSVIYRRLIVGTVVVGYCCWLLASNSAPPWTDVRVLYACCRKAVGIGNVDHSMLDVVSAAMTWRGCFCVFLFVHM